MRTRPFDPHHAMRISDGVRTLDYVICFHCLQAISYEGEAEVGTSPVTGTGADLEAIFVASGIPVVPQTSTGPKRF